MAGDTNLNVLDELRRMAHDLPAGSRLPTVRDLIARYGVSQYLVQQALQRLSADGLIVTHVGRGSFVSALSTVPPRPATKQVLTLLHHTHYERGDIIAETVHKRLTAENHTSVVLTYNDAEHAMAMLKDGPRYDSCILQPRTSIVPVRLLSVLREISSSVIIESRAVDQLDVDAISNDPGVLSKLALQALTRLGHRRIAWVVEDRGDYFYERTARLFEAFRIWTGRSERESPLIFASSRNPQFGFEDLSGALARLFDGSAGTRPTAVVLATFDSGASILSAFHDIGLSMPDDVSVIRIGTPDIESEHDGRIATVGRPSVQAAETVLARLHWRWQNPDAPFATIYDPPRLDVHLSLGPPPA
ncbi:MAG: substrate-binding domain-containing protein [Candidatus Kaistia colombiensis]|nr:MAG: substrate-binding domain-containing protein [Kaistia sp.]